MRLLLDVSASTLVTLRLCPNNPRGEDVFLKVVTPHSADDVAAKLFPQGFDLSHNKPSLHALEVTALTPEVTVFYGDNDFHYLGTPPTPLQVAVD